MAEAKSWEWAQLENNSGIVVCLTQDQWFWSCWTDVFGYGAILRLMTEKWKLKLKCKARDLLAGKAL